MKNRLLLVLSLCLTLPAFSQLSPLYFVNGQISNASGKGIKNASIHIFSINKSFYTDKSGRFSLSLPKGDYLTRITADDYKSKDVLISLQKRDTILNISLESLFKGIVLGEAEIRGRTFDKVSSSISGVEKINQSTVNKIPALLGERDPIKTLLLLPGINGTTEGGAEMNVRGGGNDQNLITLDNIPLYSSTHFFGLYSSFNPLAISSTTIYKGDFPANLGGRLSSVTNLTTTDTLTKEFSGDVELGISTAKAIVAAPLTQKSTLYLAGRRSYYDLLFNTFGKGDADIFTFQDYNLGWVYNHSSKNKFKLTLYHERDAIETMQTETGLSRGNSEKSQNAIGFNWKHQFNNKLANDLILYHNDFSSKLTEEKRNTDQSYLYKFKTLISDIGLKNNLDYSTGIYKFYGGIDLIRHQFNPTLLTGNEDGIPFRIKNISNSYATNLSFFAGMQTDLHWGGKLNTGIRNTYYLEGSQHYYSLEPRVSYLQPIHENSSLKISYSKMFQPVQRLSNPGLGLPQDIIFSAGKDIKPQVAQHISIELVKDFKLNQEQFTFSLLPFYKSLKHIISFRDGYDTRSLMYRNIYRANTFQEVITSGEGKIFGMETMLEKKTGKLNGWISYTLLKASNTFANLNGGALFSPPQDRRHTFNAVANWQVSNKWNIGFSWTFISGSPINVPESIFLPVSPDYTTGGLIIGHNNQYLFEQGNRGNYRMKPFHKLDITAEYKFKLARLDAVWNIGAYNVYNRLNSSFYYLGKSDGNQGQDPQPVLKSVSLFPMIPSSSLRVKFP